MSDLRQAPEYAQWMRAIGWQVENGMFIKKLPLVPWSFIKIQRQKNPIDFTAAQKYKAIQIKIEPAWDDKTDYQTLGFKPDKAPLLPTKTIWLDLTKNKRLLLKQMRSKTRYNINKHKQTVKVYRGKEIGKAVLRKFYEIYKANAKKQKFWGLNFNNLNHLIASFGEKAYLLWVDKQGGLLMLIYDQAAYYSHNASSQAGRDKFVPTLLTWEAIKLAKKLGCKKFDFEGIADSRFPITKKWQGFTRFKKSFGGIEVEYRDSFSKYFFNKPFCDDT